VDLSNGGEADSPYMTGNSMLIKARFNQSNNKSNHSKEMMEVGIKSVGIKKKAGQFSK